MSVVGPSGVDCVEPAGATYSTGPQAVPVQSQAPPVGGSGSGPHWVQVASCDALGHCTTITVDPAESGPGGGGVPLVDTSQTCWGSGPCGPGSQNGQDPCEDLTYDGHGGVTEHACGSNLTLTLTLVTDPQGIAGCALAVAGLGGTVLFPPDSPAVAFALSFLAGAGISVSCVKPNVSG